MTIIRIPEENHILATILEQAAEGIRKSYNRVRIIEDIDDGEPIIYQSDKLLSSMIKVTNAAEDYNKEDYMNQAKFLLSQLYIGYAPDFFLYEAQEALDSHSYIHDDVAVTPKNIAYFADWLQQSDSFVEAIADAARNELESFLEVAGEDIDRPEDENNE